MANIATNEGQGAKRSRRLVSRALLVLGGAVAGTAAAWLVSGGTASADTVEVGTAPIAEAATGSLGDVNEGATNAATDVSASSCHQDATAWSKPCARTLEHEVSERVSDSVSDLAEDAVVSPAHRTLGAVEHIARKPQDTREVLEQTFTPEPAHDVLQLLDPAGQGNLVPLPQLPGLAPVEPQGPVTEEIGQATDSVAVSAVQLPAVLRAALAMPTGVQQNDVTGAAGESRDSHRDLPSSPLVPVQLPAAPSVPTAPGGSSAPGGHLDGLNFGVPSWVSSAVSDAAASAYRGGLRHTPRTPGTQPGVTPD
ncbi:hypothetical protein [Amycolatopsis sp. WQ 127309]|uniref:hypothetical protein n=1 Tax=Amycolatopsis sp. WQ 127309 TaxID=2932773 RepID=UPI001FF66A79|nr:hypothetical protein [Amycolatopsis sp. WQ 127309]UOZ08953.1 hypothetical protein MUY22_12010 [Amycolatopsis sp. WQ 127309]